MEAIIERCRGLDVHQATVVACLRVGRAGPKPRKEVRTFGTTTRELLELRDWLATEDCTHVGMESTGIYGMPVYAVLEDPPAPVTPCPTLRSLHRHSASDLPFSTSTSLHASSPLPSRFSFALP